MNKYKKKEIPESGGISVVAGFIIGLFIYISIKTFYLNTGTATHGTGTSGGVYMTVRFMTRSFGGVCRTATKIDVVESEITFPFLYPLKLEEKTDIEVRAICNKNQNNAVSATFEGVLVDNAE